jgi:NAD(P)-dependent dehydrogenase (short-subunit alcohol dehydrogenase family)
LLPGLFDWHAVTDPDVSPIPVNLLRLEPKTARQGFPSDLSYAGLFMISDEASFISGQCLAVDGGDDVKLEGLVLD